MSPVTRLFPTIHADSDDKSSLTAAALSSVRNVVAVPENELKRWRRTFETNAKVVQDGEKWVTSGIFGSPLQPTGTGADCVFNRYLDPESFVNAIAPSGDLSKIGRAQFAILFRVADTSKRGLVSWTDFTVFESLLKKPDADYWIAFQYFDVYVPS